MTADNSLAKQVDVARRTGGYQFNRGFARPDFITNAASAEVALERPLVLLCEATIKAREEIMPLIEMVAKAGRPLLVVAGDIGRELEFTADKRLAGWEGGEALEALVDSKLRRGLAVCAVNAPGFDDRRRAMLEDIAVFTGGRVVAGELGAANAGTVFANLGTAERVIVKKEQTTVIRGGGERHAIEARMAQIHQQIAQTQSDSDREKLQERFGMLLGGLVSLGPPAGTVPGTMTRAQQLKKRAVQLAYRHPAMPCAKCGVRVFKENGSACWACGTTLDWNSSLICTRCRAIHTRPVGCCLRCASPLEHTWKCPSCPAFVGVSQRFCPKCGAGTNTSPPPLPATTIVCRACGQQTAPGAFCAKCGSPKPAGLAVIACRKCGRETPAEKFCVHCGSPVGASVPPPLPRQAS